MTNPSCAPVPADDSATVSRTMPRDGSSAAGTRLSLRDLRADALHGLLVSPRGAGVMTVEDIHRLPDLGGWAHETLSAAIADLVAVGLLSDDGHGRVRVESRS